MDITYDETLVALSNEPVLFSESFPNGQSAELGTAGLVGGVGAFAGSTPLGRDEFDLFTLRFLATAVGDLEFDSSPVALDTPSYYTLVFSQFLEVPFEDVTFGSASLSIVPEPSGVALYGCALGLGWLPSRKRRAKDERDSTNVNAISCG